MARSFVYFWPFIGDSPTAALLCSVVLLYAFIVSVRFRGAAKTRPRWLPYISAISALWLVQYGFWCVITLLWELVLTNGLPGEGWALLFVHAAMCGEAVILVLWHPMFRFSYRHVVFAAASLYLHDFVDYVYNTFPFLPRYAMLPAITVITPLITTLLLIIAWQQVRRWHAVYRLPASGKILLRGRRTRH